MDIQTEFGFIEVKSGEIVVIPRGIKFSVKLPDGPSRGYIVEVFDGHFEIPDLGPIGFLFAPTIFSLANRNCTAAVTTGSQHCSGANGLANPRDFLTPVAAYEDKETTFTVINKFGGNLWQYEQVTHSPTEEKGSLSSIYIYTHTYIHTIYIYIYIYIYI